MLYAAATNTNDTNAHGLGRLDLALLLLVALSQCLLSGWWPSWWLAVEVGCSRSRLPVVTEP